MVLKVAVLSASDLSSVTWPKGSPPETKKLNCCVGVDREFYVMTICTELTLKYSPLMFDVLMLGTFGLSGKCLTANFLLVEEHEKVG